MDLITDTSYLVGLWRGQAWATSFASVNSAKSIGLPWVVLGEFRHGAAVARHDPVEVAEFLAIGVHLLDATSVVPTYARICAALASCPEYRSIGQNDLWIAAVAVSFNKPLLTRNRRHFNVIDGLQLELLEA